ncbi:MAG: biotin transport system substrate-specific component [Acidobacteriota bacterium]|jgi:biotin transport system substrate-specific component|nr:biotin transport system substrate-specific component [Acidobacteriota bacterium]
MNTSYAKSQTLTSAVLAPLDWMRSGALVIGFSLLIALAAQIAIPTPWSDVPITGQTFAVLLTGALLGSRLGALAMIAYLIEGASGLPFFAAGGSGIARLTVSPWAGYLWAYPVAAFVTGWLAERGWDRRYFKAAAAMGLGSIVILLGGMIWRLGFMSFDQAFLTGIVPFLPGDAIKIALAAAVLPSGWALLRKSSRKN